MTGLLTLDYSLKQAGTKYPLIALYTDQFPEDGHKALQARGIHGRRVEFLNPSLQKDYSNDPRFYDTWTKLMAFSLVEYERVVLLDSDMLVRRNMDELMDLQLDSVNMQENGSRIFAAAPACACNPAKKAHYPKEWFVDTKLNLHMVCILDACLGYPRIVHSLRSIVTPRKHRLKARP